MTRWKQILPQAAVLVGTIVILVAALFWAINSYFLVPLPAVLGLVFAYFKESSASKEDAVHIVQQRKEDFRQLIGAAYGGKSIFSHSSLAGAPNTLWGKYGREKSEYLSRLLALQVVSRLHQEPDQSFERLCDLSLELGSFIAYFRESVDQQGLLDQNVKEWYNKYPLAEYCAYSNRLNNAAENLSRHFGRNIKARARSVEDNKPPQA